MSQGARKRRLNDQNEINQLRFELLSQVHKKVAKKMSWTAMDLLG
jgi:hypothetical protein